MDVRKMKVKLHDAYPYLREKSLHHWKRTQQTLDAHQTRAQMLENRKRILDKQQKMSYQNEYDRLRNALQETVLRRSVADGRHGAGSQNPRGKRGERAEADRRAGGSGCQVVVVEILIFSD